MKRILIVAVVAAAMLMGGCGSEDVIDVEKAKEIALGHAGLNGEDVNIITLQLEKEDGRSIYDVEFYSEDYTEYDYEIDAKTGEIISFDTDAENQIPSVGKNEKTPETPSQDDSNAQQSASQDDTSAVSPSSENNAAQATITEQQAKEIALGKVPGAKESDIREWKRERDDGREKYEGTIYYNKMEYDFEIDVNSGEILSWESESIFD